MPLLFSYGTLQQSDVQLATFGRQLDGRSDALTGYAPASVAIQDPHVIAATGRTHHANVRFNGDEQSRVAGTVFEVTDADLTAADGFELPFVYERVAARLASGKQAWVYVHTPSAADIRLEGLDHIAINVRD